MKHSNKKIIHNPNIHVVSDIPNLSEKEKSENTLIIGTHSGTFHADEIVAIALYSFTNSYKNIYIVRTRDLEILNKCDFVVDYGEGDYNHHTDGSSRKREKDEFGNEIPYASAGLVFSHKDLGFANKIIDNFIETLKPKTNQKNKSLKEKNTVNDRFKIRSNYNKIYESAKSLKRRIINLIDRTVILPVDARDTGKTINPPQEDILDFIPSYNPSWFLPNEPETYNDCFKDALINTRKVLQAKINNTILNISRKSENELTSNTLESESQNTSDSFIQEIGISSLFDLLNSNSNHAKVYETNTNLGIPDDNIANVWNQIGNDIITNQISMLNPTTQIVDLYNNLESEDSENNIYKAIAPTIKNTLNDKKEEIESRIRTEVYKRIILPISNHTDNSSKPSNKNVLGFLNTFDFSCLDNNPEFINQSKKDAKEVAKSILQTKIQEIISLEYAKETIQILYNNPDFFSNGILELPSQSMPWKEAICDINSRCKDSDNFINFVIFPYPDGGWAAQSVPPSNEKEFGQRVSFSQNAYPDFWVHPGLFFSRQKQVKAKIKKEMIKKLCTFSEIVETNDRWNNFFGKCEIDYSNTEIEQLTNSIYESNGNER